MIVDYAGSGSSRINNAKKVPEFWNGILSQARPSAELHHLNSKTIARFWFIAVWRAMLLVLSWPVVPYGIRSPVLVFGTSHPSSHES